MINIQSLLYKIKQWGEKQVDINAILLVGSYARNEANENSDIDLVIITGKPEKYLDDCSFAGTFGEVDNIEKEDWGKLTSLRVWFHDGHEVEFGITTPDWISEPLDPGTKEVLSRGKKVIFDRSGKLNKLLESLES